MATVEEEKELNYYTRDELISFLDFLDKNNKTKKSARTISLDDGTLATLKKWKNTQRVDLLRFGFNTQSDKQFLFTNLKNELLTPNRTRKWLLEVQDKYELKKITTHGFRHTHCSLLFEVGASLEEVQDRLGHTDVKTTLNIYTHVNKKQKKNGTKVC